MQLEVFVTEYKKDARTNIWAIDQSWINSRNRCKIVECYHCGKKGAYSEELVVFKKKITRTDVKEKERKNCDEDNVKYDII